MNGFAASAARPDGAVPAPMLWLHGEDDNVIGDLVGDRVETFRRWLPASAPEGVYPGLGHDITSGQLADAAAWLRGRLPRHPRGGTLSDAAALVRAHTSYTPDFPSPGILFRDLSGLFADPPAFRAILEALSAGYDFDAVAGAEARGFLLAAGIGVLTGTAVVPLRKPGKLPPPVLVERYALEYGSAELQLRDGVLTGRRVLIVDDVLATGGTLAAARRLLERAGNEVVGAAVVVELASLGGRAALPGLDVTAVLTEAD